MSHFFVTLFTLLSIAGFAQDGTGKNKQKKTQTDIKKFLNPTPSLNVEFIVINSDKDTLDYQKELFAKHLNDIFKIDDYSYKVIGETSVNSYRGSYIYLDRTKLSMQEIDSLRNLIIKEYHLGKSFEELAKSYSMDGNISGGDLGWFIAGTMVKEFEEGIKEHKKDDIFKVDVPSSNWFYVVKKTYDDKITKELKIVKVKNRN